MNLLTSDWVDRLALALPGLAKAQEPFLREYWEQNGGVRVVYDRRSGKPVFPLDDLRDIYASARHSNVFGKREHYAPLRAALDPVRHILVSHPALAQVVGPIIGRDDFWMQILNTGAPTCPTDLIAGLMARAHELSGDRFRQAASELKSFLDPGVERGSAFVPGELDVGYNMMLFYGLTVTEIIDVAEGIAILPYEDVRPFVDESLVDELSPDGAGFHHWRSVGAVVRPFRWRPVLNRSGYEPEPALERPKSLFLDARSILDLLAVAHEAPVVPLAELSYCINRSASRLLGWDGHDPICVLAEIRLKTLTGSTSVQCWRQKLHLPKRGKPSTTVRVTNMPRWHPSSAGSPRRLIQRDGSPRKPGLGKSGPHWNACTT